MDAITKELLTSLRDIRDKADAALRQAQMSTDQRSLAWRCTACGHIKHFTRPATADVAPPCPKCQSVEFQPV
jgi:Zn finger protein HypA/HybF involved in hydrogenase expression